MENWTWKNEIWSGVRITPKNKRFKIDIDFRFWAIISALNINLHSLELEFEWLFLGIYWNFWKNEDKPIIWLDKRPVGFNFKENKKENGKF